MGEEAMRTARIVPMTTPKPASRACAGILFKAEQVGARYVLHD